MTPRSARPTEGSRSGRAHDAVIGVLLLLADGLTYREIRAQRVSSSVNGKGRAGRLYVRHASGSGSDWTRKRHGAQHPAPRTAPRWRESQIQPHHAILMTPSEGRGRASTADRCVDREINPVLPLSPGRAERHGFEYIRHGTLSLYAALERARVRPDGGTPHQPATSSKVPRRRTSAITCAHKTTGSGIARSRIWRSSLNQVELWFQDRDLIRGVFTSKITYIQQREPVE